MLIYSIPKPNKIDLKCFFNQNDDRSLVTLQLELEVKFDAVDLDELLRVDAEDELELAFDPLDHHVGVVAELLSEFLGLVAAFVPFVDGHDVVIQVRLVLQGVDVCFQDREVVHFADLSEVLELERAVHIVENKLKFLWLVDLKLNL